jgi:hypothetical protein
LDIKNHEEKHKNQAGESFLNPSFTPKMTPMQNQTNKTTVDEYVVNRIAHALSADRIIEIKPVSENTYFVVYDYCECGYCYYVESHVTVTDRSIREKIIRMM